MKTVYTPIPALIPGQPLNIARHTFGPNGKGQRAYIQAGLHADEHPGMLVIQHLMEMLDECEKHERLVGEVTLVPLANPVGLMQNVLGYWTGRFNLANGENFNRHFPDPSYPLEEEYASGQTDPGEMLKRALGKTLPADTVGQMKHALLTEALSYDLVLDLHCDTDSILHLYTNRVHQDRAKALAGALGAEAVFVENHAGGQPFDEAIFRTWRWFADKKLVAPEDIPFSVTVELRGQSDVSDALAKQDAAGIINFLIGEGIIIDTPPQHLNLDKVKIYPLEGASHVMAPENGIISWLKRPGQSVYAGELIAEIVPLSGEAGRRRTPIFSDVTGIMVARPIMKMIRTGQRLALLAGSERLSHREEGNLLKHF